MDLVTPIVDYVVRIFNDLLPLFALAGAFTLGKQLFDLVVEKLKGE